LSGGAIAGIVIGSLALVAIAALFGRLVCRKGAKTTKSEWASAEPRSKPFPPIFLFSFVSNVFQPLYLTYE
jgi:hypothetical protein